MSWLRENCPRLYWAATEQRQLLVGRERRARQKRRQLENLERLVAHRELQLLRAGTTRDRRYVDARAAKLAAADHALKHVRADLESVDSWEPRWARSVT